MLALAILPVALLAGCGSSSPDSHAASTAARVKRTCRQLAAVLSDGPEPNADPVGYAQAQILPLREIHTPDAKLATAIGRLASAYQRFSASHGSSAAQTAVSAATRTLDALCPGTAA